MKYEPSGTVPVPLPSPRKPDGDRPVGDRAPRLREAANEHPPKLDEGQLLVAVEPRDADADEAQRSGALAQRAVEQAAGEGADRLGVVDPGAQRRGTAAD